MSANSTKCLFFPSLTQALCMLLISFHLNLIFVLINILFSVSVPTSSFFAIKNM